GADVVAGARLILDEHLLAPHRGKLVCEHARDNIRRTSRGDRHNDAHGFGWVAGLGRLRAPRERPGRRRAAEKRDEIAPPHEADPKATDYYSRSQAGSATCVATKNGASCPLGSSGSDRRVRTPAVQ